MKKKVKKKRVINWQKIFSFVSFIFIIICILWYGGRFIYFYLDSKKTTSEVSDTFATSLIANNKDNGNLKKVNDDYYFNGSIDNNYVTYSNMIWRIVKIDSKNRITLISENVIGTLNMGDNDYDKSNVIYWLNKVKDINNSGILENVLSDTDKILTKVNVCIDSINNVEKLKCAENNKDYKIGLLSIWDYVYTGGDKGFINNGKATYLSNRNKSKDAWYINSDGKIDVDSNQSIIGIKPIITLKADINTNGGTGTKDDPYTLGEESTYFASYVKLGEDTWRVYEVSDDKLKLILNDTIMEVNKYKNDSDEDKLKYIYSKTNYQHNDTIYGSLAYYLNKTYYNSLDYRSIITSNNYVNGFYGEDNKFVFSDIYSNVIETKVSLPSLSDIIVNDELDGYVTNTGTNDSGSLIYIRKANGEVTTKNVTTENYVVPCITIEKSVLVSGSGTYDDPYRQGDFE